MKWRPEREESSLSVLFPCLPWFSVLSSVLWFRGSIMPYTFEPATPADDADLRHILSATPWAGRRLSS